MVKYNIPLIGKVNHALEMLDLWKGAFQAKNGMV